MRKNQKHLFVPAVTVHDMLGIRWAEGESNSGGDTGGSESNGSTDNADATSSKTGQASSDSSTSKTGEQSKSGQRDAATDDTSKTDQQQKPGDGDGSRALKALEKEREARKAADQTVKDMQTELAAVKQRAEDDRIAIGKAFGFTKDDTPPDPEALQRAVAERDARLTDAQAEKDREVASRDDTIRQQRVELAAWRLGSDPKLGANVAALLDSRRVADSIAHMDPAGDSFEKDITAVIKAAVEANPAYRINQAAAAADAGIGATGAKNNDAHITPGVGRLRAGYGAA